MRAAGAVRLRTRRVDPVAVSSKSRPFSIGLAFGLLIVAARAPGPPLRRPRPLDPCRAAAMLPVSPNPATGTSPAAGSRRPIAPTTAGCPAPVPSRSPAGDRHSIVSRPGAPADRPGRRPAPGRARDLDIAIARQRVLQAVADLEQARALWLPSLFIGPTYYRADGQVQTITGQVVNVNRSSLSLGSTAALANGFPAASPGTGYPQLNGLSSVLRISDAIFEPLAARRVSASYQAGLQATANNALLAVSEAYFDLQLAAGGLAIAREAAGNAEMLTLITEAYARTGQGLEADHRRALAELRGREQSIWAATGQLKVASANLVRPLVLEPEHRRRPGRAGRVRRPAGPGRHPPRLPDRPTACSTAPSWPRRRRWSGRPCCGSSRRSFARSSRRWP